jgi:serine protease Do
MLAKIAFTLVAAAASAKEAVQVPPTTGFADVVERNLPSVVRLVTSGGTKSGEGSGVVLSADGLIVTNYHVVAGAKRIRVQLNDGREFDGRLIAGDAPIDLAVLKIDATVQPVTFGDSTRLRIGEYVLAIGNPFGVGTSVTLGIVSAMSPSRLGIAGDEDYIQTDAAVNPGNSGGPLINTRGELVGINTAILSPSGGSSGIGFALPSNVVGIVAKELVEKGHFDRGYLGVGVQPMSPALAEAFGIDHGAGAVITDVAAASPADRAGLRKGDVITGMNGRPVRDFNRLRLYIAEARPAVATQLEVVRDGQEKNYWIVLDKRPAAVSAEEPLAAAQDAAWTGKNDPLPGAVIADLNDRHRQELGLPASMKGVVLTTLDPEGAAAEGGLRPGDVVVVVNRTPVADSAALRAAVMTDRKVLLLEVNRQGTTFFFAVTRP